MGKGLKGRARSNTAVKKMRERNIRDRRHLSATVEIKQFGTPKLNCTFVIKSDLLVSDSPPGSKWSDTNIEQIHSTQIIWSTSDLFSICTTKLKTSMFDSNRYFYFWLPFSSKNVVQR